MTPVDTLTETNSAAYQSLKGRIHQDLLNRLNLDRLTRVTRAEAEPEVRAVIRDMLDRESQRVPLSFAERESLIGDVLNELFGLGPLEALLKDPEISDILVNNASQVFIERNGRIEDTGVVFRDDQHLMQIIERIVSAVGRRIDESTPMVDARLQDGSRVNAIIPPLSLDGPALTIRKFAADPYQAEDLVQFGTMTTPVVDFLESCVRGKINIMVSGGTGAGKTTTLNVLSSFIPDDERIITIEDAAELKLQQPHVVRLEYRPANIEGRGEVTIRDLVKNSLRMRPDRIVVGEVRGGEALDMLQAMNTGHDGSISTIHSNSPRDSLSRLETVSMMAGMDLGQRAIREQISNAVQLIVHQSRLKDGSRRLTHVTEVVGMEGEVITLQDLFLFDFNAGVDEDGKFRGHLKATGLAPAFLDKLAERGVFVDPNLFAPDYGI